MTLSSPLLEARHISKQFPGVQALSDVSLTIRAGEVLALVGENGAGKSTLMKILAGVQPPDTGELLLNGQPLHLKGVAAALDRGIVLIHQELNQAENLSIAANLFLGRERVRFGLLDRKGMNAQTRQLLDRVGLPLPPSQLVSSLSLGQQQLVEIARALSLSARVLIMDEPTSSLTPGETERLFEVIAGLKSAGVAIVYISHRLAEVQRIADRVEVLRDGRSSGRLSHDEITQARMVQLMVGRDVKQLFHRQRIDRPVCLELRGVCYADGPKTPVSFAVRSGEIVGLAGLVGAGRTELAEALFGLRRLSAGEIFVRGKAIRPRSPAQAIAAGLLLAPEDRRLHGLVLPLSVQGNLGLPNLTRLSRFGLVSLRRERELAENMRQKLQIKTPVLSQPVGLLSGGNQQKVVLGKWLARQPSVLILDEPTRGVDVGAKSEIYALMDELAQAGVGILMISSDLEEVLGMSDRVLVLHEGRLAGELARGELSEEAVMNLATGGEAKRG